MSPKKLRLLAECLESGYMLYSDRKGWANDLRGMAKDIERRALECSDCGAVVCKIIEHHHHTLQGMRKCPLA